MTDEFGADHYLELKGLIKQLDINLGTRTSMLSLLSAVNIAYEDTGDRFYENVIKSSVSLLTGDTP